MSLLPSSLSAYLQTLFWSPFRIYRSPESPRDTPRLPHSLLWLALLGTVTGTNGMYASLLGKTAYGQPWIIDVPMSRAISQGIWMAITVVFWAALLTWFLARIARDNIRLDLLYAILGIATIPWIVPALLYPLREMSLSYLTLWRYLHWISTFATCGLIVAGVRSGMSSTLSKAAQCALPAILMTLTLAIRADRATPTTFRTVCKWQTVDGQHVRVYTPAGKPPEEIREIVRGADRLVEEEIRTLGLPSTDEEERNGERNGERSTAKIELFLFADDALQRRLAGNEEEPDDTAHSFWDCITMAYAPWKPLRQQMAHEICHVLLASRISDQVHGLLDEGLCEYVAHRVMPEPQDPHLHIATSLPLRVLAHPPVFFDWDEVEQTPDGSRTYYITAQALVTYLIEYQSEHQGRTGSTKGGSGMERYKRFYKTYADSLHANDLDQDEANALSKALNEVYGTTTASLETKWRQTMKPE